MEPAFVGKVILPILFLSITACTTLRVENQPAQPSDTLPTTPIRWHVDADCMSRTSQNANTTRGLELSSAFHYHVALKQYAAPAVVEILARLKGDADRLENRRVTT
jgi:hypothetical protein